MRNAHRVAAIVAFALLGTTRANAQASLYVPLDDIAYRYADALIARGELRGVSLLERPYTALQLAAGADTALARVRAGVTRSYAIALRTALQRYAVTAGATAAGVISPDGTARFFGNADLFATGQTSGETELMQADTNRSITGGAGVRLAMVAGPMVAMIHPIVDNRLNNDPDFGGRKDRSIAGRLQDGYVAGQWEYAELFFGRTARNWGPYSLTGQQLGSSPYTYDHLYFRGGTSRIHIASVAAKLDEAFEPDGVHARYFYTHRLGVRLGGLEVAASEGYIAAGIARGIEPTLLNPLGIYALSWRNERTSGNLSLGGNIAYRTRNWGSYSSELYLDDIQIDKCATACKEPSSYGLTLAAEGVPLYGAQRAFASYTRLTGLAYRTPEISEQYSVNGIGLGQRFTDYDEARAGADLALVPYLTLRAYGAYRRQGQGDYHLPYPAVSQYGMTRGFLQGTIEHVARLAVQAAYTIAPGVELTGDIGVNHATNFEHIVGSTRNMPAGDVRLQWSTRSLTF